MRQIIRHIQRTAAHAAGVISLCLIAGPVAAEPGVGADVIRVGGVMDLKGDSRGLGLGMKAGIEAAFRGVTVKGRRLEFVPLNDNYSPPKTVEATEKLLDDGVFAMLGNVGTPTAKVSLPILAANKTPAVGFFTGAGILRPGVGDIVNFRASYVQETAAVIESALNSGISARGICAYVQNDAYGMAGVAGIKKALEGIAGKLFVSALERIDGPITRRNFLRSIRGQSFDLGGMPMDFVTDNQGSDYVALTYLAEGGYRDMSVLDWQTIAR